MPAQLRSWVTILSLAASMGCNGLIGDAAAMGDPDGSDGGTTDPPPCDGPVCMPASCDGVCIGSSRLARLTRDEYRNSVEVLFGVRVDPDRLPRDHEIYESFATNEPEAITTDDVDSYAAMAEDVAAEIDARALSGCGEGDLGCVELWIEEMGLLVHRRPLSTEERDAYIALVEWSIDEGDAFDEALELLVSALLQSPYFLYRVEPALEGEPVALDGFAIATRLSFFLWRSTPDEALLAAAAAGELDDPDGIEHHARRLLADRRADEAIRAFHRDWLGIGEVELASRTDESFSEELGRSMRLETEELAVHVFREQEGSFAALTGGETTMIDQTMAVFYEVDAPSGDGFAPAVVPGRRGVFTHASVMTQHAADSYTDPIYRGKLIRQRVLCQQIAPPPDVSALVAEREEMLGETSSERERLDALTSGPPCEGCHVLTNDIGFGFANYDSIGRFREVDGSGERIDATFEVESPPGFVSDLDGAYAGATDFAEAIAESDDAALCMSAQWMRFALGRRTDVDGFSVEDAARAFAESGFDLRELVVAVTRSDAFRYRLPPE